MVIPELSFHKSKGVKEMMGFRALTVDMLAVNDLIEVKGKHIEEKKA